MLGPAAPKTDKANRNAARSRAVERDLTCDQYGTCCLGLGRMRSFNARFLSYCSL